MLETSTIGTPTAIKDKHTPIDGNTIDPFVYRNTINGALQYLTFTRPDIVHTVNQVS